jgi:hypothetical protein
MRLDLSTSLEANGIYVAMRVSWLLPQIFRQGFRTSHGYKTRYAQPKHADTRDRKGGDNEG